MPSGNSLEERLKRRRAKLGGGGKGKDKEFTATTSSSPFAPSAANRAGKTGQLGPGRTAGEARLKEQTIAKGRAAARGDRPKTSSAPATAAAATTDAVTSPSIKGGTKAPVKAAPAKAAKAMSPAKSPAPPSPPSKPSMTANATSATTATSKAPHTAATYGGSKAVNGSNGTVKVKPKPWVTRSDATGSQTGERARLGRYSAMDRNK